MKSRIPSEGGDPRRLAGKRLGIFGKGGSGKSTVTVLLTGALRERGHEVVVLDADSTNVGLSAALGLERPPQPLIEQFGGMIFSGGSVTCPVDDPTPLAGADISLARLPKEFVGRTAEGIRVLVAGKMGELGAGAGCDGPIAKIARDLRIHGDGQDPVTLIDFKAGFEDSARGVLTGLDRAIVVVDPTVAAVRMAVDLKKTIEGVREGALPATRHLEDSALVQLARSLYRKARIRGMLCVLNRIPDDETESYLRARLAQQAIQPAAAIRADRSITVSWLRGMPFDAAEAAAQVRDVAEMLEAAERSEETVTVS